MPSTDGRSMVKLQSDHNVQLLKQADHSFCCIPRIFCDDYCWFTRTLKEDYDAEDKMF